MSQTRQLAAQYREATGQSLPVTVELARFDATTLLGLKEIEGAESEALLIEGVHEKLVQIKGRVIFPGTRSQPRVGQLNIKSDWDYTVLVIYNPHYQPQSIYQVSREAVEKAMQEANNNKRGSMTVAKFKAIGQLIWEQESSESESAQ
ncbi:hypothetical protein [Pleionea sediminis]|uniref:hypothetical protein n=1 Tax=Pleionea sediminis TaxID=2569479 RepID=UPI00197C72B4|nr:hypothetical protein [Pleionea sediminis]